MNRAVIRKLADRIDAIELRQCGPVPPLYCICRTLDEGRAALELYLEKRPRDRARRIHIIATGVPGRAVINDPQRRMAMAKVGERNPDRLCDDALDALRGPPPAQ